MKSTTRISLLITSFLTLAGCASAPVTPLARPIPGSSGEVIIYREYAFAAGGVALTVGSENTAFANISNDEKVRALLPVGETELFVQARSAEATKLRVKVKRDTPVCVRTSASPSTYAKAVIPITLIATGYHFYLDEVQCPSTAVLSKYKDVLVNYK